MTVIVENVGNEEFSKVLFCLVEQYNNTYDEIGSRLKESAHTMLRNWCKLQMPLLYSDAAWEMVNSGRNYFEDPGLSWHSINGYGKDGKGRSNLVFEHTTPIAEFFNELLTCKSQIEVLDKLDSYSGICWITREEKDRLTKKYHHKRPGGWRKCYEDCGIIVEEDEDYEDEL
tara:strand:+ start:61 stop:576 length:516 start_codon:yes stop_codon:yes gene_type:complete